ncbi:MAG TPA: GntR family transcriptional regulator [Treponema sp.]|nr:GntR family transcriptional regulator [Treponema sp.]
MKNNVSALGRIDEKSGRPKFLQVADRIRELIDGKQLQIGDRLPSVNQIIKHFSISRDTAVKAYKRLKDIGIIESSPNKAYFVSNTFLHDKLKHVLLLTDSNTPYKEQIYYGIIDNLPKDFYIDVISHNDNFEILKMVYETFRAKGNCVYFLIIPTASQSLETKYFQFINPGNILFLDRPVPGVPHPAIFQDFSNGFYTALTTESQILKKYKHIIFLTKHFTNQLIEMMKTSLMRFADSAQIPFSHQHTLFSEKEIQNKIEPKEGELYIILDDILLIETIKSCKNRNLEIGNQIGIIIINDGPFYDQLPTTISVLSTDFYQMGAKAAAFVTDGLVENKLIPTKLIVRESL